MIDHDRDAVHRLTDESRSTPAPRDVSAHEARGDEDGARRVARRGLDRDRSRRAREGEMPSLLCIQPRSRVERLFERTTKPCISTSAWTSRVIR